MPLTDAHGDPLPPGAVARIGTIRLRHGGTVSSLAFSPDGKRLVSTDGDTVGIWDARTGRSLSFRFLPWQYRLWSPVVSPDGTLIACRLENGALGVQETETGKQRCAFPSSDQKLYNLAFSRDNRLLACNDEEATVLLWDVAGGKLARRWKSATKEDQDSSRQVFTPDGKGLIHATKRGHIFLRDVKNGKELFHIRPRENEADYIYSLAISPDGEMLATTFDLQRIKLWESKTGRFLRETEVYGVWAGLHFSPDGKHLLTGTREGAICFSELTKGKLTRRLVGNKKGASVSLTFSPDGKVLACGGKDHAIHLWDISANKELSPPAPPGGEVSASFHVEGQNVLVHSRYWTNIVYGTVDPHLGFWDLKGNAENATTIDPKEAHAFDVSPDAKLLVLVEGLSLAHYHRVFKNGELQSTLRLSDLTSGKELQIEKNLPCDIHHVRFSPDGEFLFADADNPGPNPDDYHRLPVVQVWKRTSPTTLKKIDELPSRGYVESFYCAPDSRWVAVPLWKGWNFHHCETGKLYRSHPTLAGAVRAASPSGRVLACSVDDERTASLVELATGKPICKLDCKPRYLVRPRFAVSPDGRIVAGDLNSATITLWDAFSGKQIGKLEGHRGDIRSLCFSADGRYLVSGSADTTALVWDYRKMLPEPAEPIRHTPERLEQLWLDLHDGDAGRGYRAVAALVAAPKQAVTLLRRKITLPTADEQRRIQAWIDDLSSAKFAVRSRAMEELTRLSELAVPALRQVLCDSLPLEPKRRIEALLDRRLSISPGPWLATLRAFEVLELIGTAEARQLLLQLSKGQAESPQTQEAKRTLERLRSAVR
jgi:WD40 repeat protein